MKNKFLLQEIVVWEAVHAPSPPTTPPHPTCLCFVYGLVQDIKRKVKQVHGAECNVVFLVVFSVFPYFLYSVFPVFPSIFFNIKNVQYEECNMKNVQHGKSAT